MSAERIEDRYPAFLVYGDKQEFLTPNECESATTEERIRSIWPFIRRQVMRFQKTLKPRERVNFDPEDTIMDLYVVLTQKDAEWIPLKGRYITFAGVIIDRELCSIRDRSRTVESPRNSNCRLREYQAEKEAGTLTDRRRITAAQIAKTHEISPIAPSPGCGGVAGVTHDNPAENAVQAEDLSRLSDAVKSAVRKALSPFEAAVIGRLYGLWGHSAMNVFLVSWETGASQSEVRKARSRACIKIRDYLVSVDHPAAGMKSSL